MVDFPTNITRELFDILTKITRTRERMLTVAAAAKLYFFERNKYPKTASDIIPRYLPGLPPDYFTGTGLKLIGTDSTFTVYSVGPDADDNEGKIIYNPENGIASKGDIVLTLTK